MSVDLRLGRWQDALADVEMVDAVITDPPYSERTHASHDAGAEDATADVERPDVRDNKERLRLGLPAMRRKLGYTAFADADVAEMVSSLAPRCRGWFVVITDHGLIDSWSRNLESVDRYVFAPLPLVETGSRVRLSGDGPSSWTCWIVASRPRNREFQSWGTLPGAYVQPCERGRIVVGGKPLASMRALVSDYTRPGDLVCDPCAGGATTLLAAAIEGRRAIGSEMDPETFAKAQKRIARGYTPTMFADAVPEMKQEPLL